MSENDSSNEAYLMSMPVSCLQQLTDDEVRFLVTAARIYNEILFLSRDMIALEQALQSADEFEQRACTTNWFTHALLQTGKISEARKVFQHYNFLWGPKGTFKLSEEAERFRTAIKENEESFQTFNIIRNKSAFHYDTGNFAIGEVDLFRRLAIKGEGGEFILGNRHANSLWLFGTASNALIILKEAYPNIDRQCRMLKYAEDLDRLGHLVIEFITHTLISMLLQNPRISGVDFSPRTIQMNQRPTLEDVKMTTLVKLPE